MNWYEEGRRWFDRSNSDEGYRLYGQFSLTHLRALLRLTNNSAEWLEAKRGFYGRMREINQLPVSEMFGYYERMRNASF